MDPAGAGHDLNEDQQGFLAFLADLTDAELISTYRSYQVIAEFGPLQDTWKRDACRSLIQSRLGSCAVNDIERASARGGWFPAFSKPGM